MNQEQYNKIKEYRTILINAFEAQFVRGVELSQFNAIKKVYEQITNDIYNGFKINCSSCVIRLYTMIGEALIQYEKNILIKIDNNDDLIYIEDTKINNKVGRPKKS